MKKRCRDGVICVVCLYALSLHLVAVVFGTAILTSLYIFGKYFIYLFIFIFLRDFVKRPMSEVAEVLTVVFPPITFIRVCAASFTNKSMVSFQILVNEPPVTFPYLIYSRHLSNNVTWHNFEHVGGIRNHA